jgi:phage/plasmid-associated DNA primase
MTIVKTLSNGNVSEVKNSYTFQRNLVLTRANALNAVTSKKLETLKDGFMDLLNADKANVPKNWAEVAPRDDAETFSQALYENLKKGYTVRLGLKKLVYDGDKAKEITVSASGALVDFDLDTPGEMTNLMHDGFLAQYASVYYYTVSYIEGVNERCRFLIPYSRTVTAYEASVLQCWFVKIQFRDYADPSCIDAARLYFPPKTEEDIDEIDFKNSFPVDEFLPIAESQLSEIDLKKCGKEFNLGKKVNGSNGNGNGNGNGKAIKSTRVRTKSTTSFIDTTKESTTEKVTESISGRFLTHISIKFGDDIESVFNQYGHNFTEVPPDSDDLESDAARCWTGLNPWTQNKSGGSFKVTYTTTDKWMFVARGSGKGKEDGDRRGNLIDYYFYIAQSEGLFSSKLGGLDSSTFKPTLQLMIDRLGLEITLNELFREPSLDEVFQYIIDNYTGRLYSCRWTDSSSKTIYFAYDRFKKNWYYSNLDRIYRNIHSDLVAVFGERLDDSKVVKQIRNKIDLNWIDELEIEKPIPEVTYLIPFVNGLLDVNTKELISDTPHIAYNKYIYKRNFTQVKNDHPVIQILLTYFQRWSKSEVIGKVLLNWLILSAQRKAQSTGKIIALVGESGAGKTTYGALVANVVGEDFSINMQAAALIGVNVQSHAMAQIEGKYYVHLMECKGDTVSTDMTNLKVLSGNKNVNRQRINPKGEPARDITFNGAVSFDSEKTIRLPVGESDGYLRRFVMIEVQREWKNESLLEDLLVLEGNCETILDWALMQDGETIYKEFMELIKHPELSVMKQTMRDELNPLVDFIESCLIITNDAKDKLTNAQMQTVYMEWWRDFGGNGNGLNLQTLKKALLPMLYDRGLSLENEIASKGNFKMNGALVRGYVGVKFGDSDFENECKKF